MASWWPLANTYASIAPQSFVTPGCASTSTTVYLMQFLRSQAAYFERLARGATIKGITREIVDRLEIPLPPLAEQQRIAAILDQAEALRAKRRHALAQLDTLTQSLFLDLFGDRGNNAGKRLAETNPNWSVAAKYCLGFVDLARRPNR